MENRPVLVMKFGGASVKDAPAVRNVGEIIQRHSDRDLVVVISAMDKTTNHLEVLARLAKECQAEAANTQLEKIRSFHYGIAEELFGEDLGELGEMMGKYFAEIGKIVQGILLLEDFPPRTYDRIVAYGELLSTAIATQYLRSAGLPAHYLDARAILKTDATPARAKIVWSLTRENIRREVPPLFAAGKLIVTQGFIASGPDGITSTLGREGSDYTAAIFAHCLDAEKLIVWKDVRGVLNADPRRVPDALKIDGLSYEEAVEMTFYGATVIHPKTIKPLYNKRIPLEVKCFKDLSESGTKIAGKTETAGKKITSTIVKSDQSMLRIQPKDFSFMESGLISKIYRQILRSGARVNLIQSSAISLTLCIDGKSETVNELVSLLLDEFHLERNDGLELTTYLNFSPENWKSAEGAAMVQQSENKLFVVKALP